MESLFATILPLITQALSILLIVLLIAGSYVCWKKSFKEGALFFIVVLIHEAFMYVSSHYLFYYVLPSLVSFISSSLMLLAFVVLLVGIVRLYNSNSRTAIES
ncbi:hypothetical protein [Alteribacter natronophilus]|uniref:hypothetical protein n=1 Tax=Alteribacter natronophilus TaxID=2583810 RepID=UPI00110F586E|nr:hypothetical protein [Alteribacter natronophilus]TMW72806.1 hypothetical protein FGB90_00385 [Alteribacter natronophilus]